MMGTVDRLWGPTAPFATPQQLANLQVAAELDVDDPDDLARLTSAVTDATQILYLLSGQTITGALTDTVRPVLADRGSGTGLCYDLAITAIPLQWPVHQVEQVTLDGEIITDWYVTDDRDLRRAYTSDGKPQYWPSWQRLDLPDTEVGTFSVTYTHGVPLPLWAIDACLELAAGLLEFDVRGSAKLPPGVTSVSRQGVSYSVLDRMQALKDGMTPDTLPSVVRFAGLTNRHSEATPTYIYSPDLPRLTRVTDLPGS